MRCPVCGHAFGSIEISNNGVYATCIVCRHGWSPKIWKGKVVSEISLPEVGRWIRIKQPRAGGVTRIHEGPVCFVRPSEDCSPMNWVRLGVLNASLSFDIGADAGHGRTTWEYVSPPEPVKDGSFWVIPAVAPDNYDVIWQRREDLCMLDEKVCWVRAGRHRPIGWDEIPGRERGYLLEVRRD